MSEKFQTILAFDFGKRRIGVAVGQTLSRTAEPLTTVTQKPANIDWQAIDKIVREWRPDLCVVGFPATADGGETPIHVQIKRFAATLKERFDVPVEFCDERLSSYEAEHHLQESRHDIDALAAQIILETWLNDKHLAKN
ncbi:MAG: Holliday junction resolvase RuvX [Pseudomonadota bacterium]